MLYTLLSKKTFLVGLLICVLFVAGSLVYQQSVKRDAQKQAIDTERFLQQLETRKTPQMPQHIETNRAEGLEDDDIGRASDNGHNSASEPTEMVSTDNEELIEVDGDLFVDEIPETDDVLVSPYGFGPYPEIPAGFPEHLMPVWTWTEVELEKIVGRQKDFELMHRVLIKLWNQGDQAFIGVSLNDQNGKVYPTYQNVMYVTDWVERQNGTIRLPTSFFGASQEDIHIVDIMKYEQVPDSITFLDANIEGYDPYQFLDLR